MNSIAVFGRLLGLSLAIAAYTPCTACAAATSRDELAALDITTFPADKREDARRMLARDVSERLRAANRRESEAWHAIGSREAWETYAGKRIAALRSALNVPPADPQRPAPKVTVTRTLNGDGWAVDNIAFESRPGLFVTANLYRPAKPPASLPAILLSHSHHNPKTEGELRDMGASWARAGCYVFVPDHLGHGERREHPFVAAESYPKPFRAGRQDYYFRYNTSLQLYAAGETLMGWMAHDLIRCVDVLLAQPGIDGNRIALLGAVAGGGDPAAVAAALDPRIKAVAPFNFGGPQPETRYPLPDDAETWFNYAGGGSWESTRNLYRSAADGFLPWVIVGSVAPRTLVYGHEFAWDQPRDPVWKRFETIWGWYDAKDKLGFAHGRGGLSGRPPEATHCNNIGSEHRKHVAAWLKKAVNIPEPVVGGERPKPEDLLVKPADAGLKPLPLREVLGRIVDERVKTMREKLEALPAGQSRVELRAAWTKVLGNVEPPERGVRDEIIGPAPPGPNGLWMFQHVLSTERNITLPMTLLSQPFKQKRPAVIMFAQQGKAKLLAARKDDIAKMIDAGVLVCLVDLRGCGETAPGTGRGRSSEATSISASSLMLGEPLLAGQLRDIRGVLRQLRSPSYGLVIDPTRIAVWGDSLSPVNPPDVQAAVPLDADQPPLAEPNAALLAMLAGLFEENVTAVYARGGLAKYRDVLRSQFVHLPHDAVTPGVLLTGDVDGLSAALSPTPLRRDGPVDSWNRSVEKTKQADATPAEWVIQRLRRE